MNTITHTQQQVANQQTQLQRVIHQHMNRLQERLSARINTLNTANPSAILARGYAIVTDEQGNIIKSATQVTTDDRLTIQLHTDQLNVRVED